ncbi:AraC-like DNA-binding protein [Streptomyces umbrinus]|uniref:helix-turn-helix domain-containing protein n=1 Tax=Streptomyces umbrinus TaxID=67370 RepID=UPI00167EDC26|nr:helix-turn-helix domain-containing protein [Streptomyces umbrinus]MCR3724809.1 AraC-like DNA-binding protein [Streptomyces umbrinus]GHH60711.1 transcriptional regulator [Streptomyces umbrinus]
MNSTGVDGDGTLGAFSVDSTVPGAVPRGFDAFLREWETRIGDGFPQPTYSPATIADFRVKGRVSKVRDVAITDVHGVSAIRTAGTPGGVEDQVRMYMVRRGAWTLGGSRDDAEHTIQGGQFLLRHVGRPSHFETVPHTTAQVLVLPAAMLKPLLGNRIMTGSADSAEVRLLAAHSSMVHATMSDLSPAGVEAAHSSLIELAKAVALHRFDDVEPRLAPALAQAAKDLANSQLADPELSPPMLARELNVSVRTLQRAFATTGESATSYIRHRRLEEARLALTTSSGRLSVSELAAHWQFADSSHFIRAFKKRYGQTPTEYARSTRPAGS